MVLNQTTQLTRIGIIFIIPWQLTHPIKISAGVNVVFNNMVCPQLEYMSVQKLYPTPFGCS
jgi:hypothetical protein